MLKRKKYKRFDRAITFKLFGWTVRVSRDKPDWKYKKTVKPDSKPVSLFREA